MGRSYALKEQGISANEALTILKKEKSERNSDEYDRISAYAQ